MAKSIEELQLICNQFPRDFESASLATISEDGSLLSSYAPFVYMDNDYYFLISRIAPHYQNLSSHPGFSFNLLEDEAIAKSIFFRRRLTYQATAKIVDPTEELKESFFQRFGEMATMLLQMDFVIVKAELLRGSMVLGAGQAYEISASQQVLEQIRSPHGHGHQR